MSSDAYLEQISPYLLDRFKAYPALTDIYRRYYDLEESMKSGLDLWSAIQDLQNELAAEWEGIFRHKRIQPEDYENVKMDIPLILSEVKNPTFHLGTRSSVGGGYEPLQIFLAGSLPDGSWITRYEEKMGNLLFVNLLEGGQRIGIDIHPALKDEDS